MSGHDRIAVAGPTGHHMGCSCGWTSEGCETPALAFRAYVAHIDSHAAAVASSIIAATPAHALPKPRHDGAESDNSGAVPSTTEETRAHSHTR